MMTQRIARFLKLFMLKMRLRLLLLAGVLLVDALALECVPRKNCPSITGSEHAHSTWYLPPIHKGENFQAWQVFNTRGRASDLHVHWRRTPYPLDCSTVNINTSVIDNFINASITVYNATVLMDGSCSDEGEYQLIVSNNCTCNDTIVFHLSFLSACTSDSSPPVPAGPRTVVVPEPRPGDPTTFCLNMNYVGDTDESDYDTWWLRGDTGDCDDTSSLVCTDDGLSPWCSRTVFGNCTFLSYLCKPNYTKSFSGNYTTLACYAYPTPYPAYPTPYPSKATTLDLRILGWPRLIQWPGGTVSTVERIATLTYQLSNYSRKFLDLKFYNSSKLVNASLNQVEIICENTNCETVTVNWMVLAGGEYKMCYNFSGEVNWTFREDSPPEYKVPNCTQYTHVIPARTKTLGTPEIVGIAVGAVIAASILFVLAILFIRHIVKKVETPKPPTQLTGMPDGETERLLRENHTPPKYGSSDESTGEEPAGINASEHVLTQEIPTDDDTVHGHVSAQGCVVAVGRQSGDDKTSSPNTINEPSTCTPTAAGLTLAPPGVQYPDDEMEKDSPYDGTRKPHLKKVFILSPHNPDKYTQPQLPTQQPMSSTAVHQFENEQNEPRMNPKITKHQDEVYRFAYFLQRNCVAVAYDLMLKDTPTSNILNWVEKQIEDSDYVILIITPSFKEFLVNPPPHEKEWIFGTDYVSRLVGYSSSKETKFLVVFLNREKDKRLLPTTLLGHTLYKICEPFEIGKTRHDDLEDLYAALTNQKRYTPSEPPGVILLTKPTEDQQRLYEDLSSLDTEVTRELIARITQKECVFQHYKRIATTLGIPAVEVERKREEISEQGDDELCYTLLLAWKDQPNTDTTIKTLAKALVKVNPSLLEELHSAVTSIYSF